MVKSICVLASALVLFSTTAPIREGAESIIGGTVVDIDTLAAIEGATVVLRTGALTACCVTKTDVNGKFKFLTNATGMGEVVATKQGFVLVTTGGSSRGLRSRRQILLGDSDNQEVWLGLERAGSIEGTIGTPNLTPIFRAMVGVARRHGSTWLTEPVVVYSDREGKYRIDGLERGDYVVFARPAFYGERAVEYQTNARVDAELERLMSGTQSTGSIAEPVKETIVTTFFGGASEHNSASVVSVVSGETVSGINIAMQSSAMTFVEGEVVGLPRNSLGLVVNLVRDSVVQPGSGDSPRVTRSGLSGEKFRFENVLPGRYRLVARAQQRGEQGSSDEVVEWEGRVDLQVPSSGVSGIAVGMSSGTVLSVKIVGTDGLAENRIAAVGVLRMWRIVDGAATEVKLNENRFVWRDGLLMIPKLLPGTYVADVEPGEAGGEVFVEGMTLNGVDVRDLAWELKAEPATAELAVVLVRQLGKLSGKIEVGEPHVAKELWVVVLPEDIKDMSEPFRRTRFARLGEGGNFEVLGLNVGTYRLAVVDAEDPLVWLWTAKRDDIYRQTVLVNVTDRSHTVVNVRAEVKGGV